MNKKILLIEDEQLIREMYVMVLKEQGYQVDTIDNGQLAMHQLSQSDVNYDLILLDIMLPELDGISILRKLKNPESPSRKIPVFLLTNLGMEDIIQEALSLGAIKYIIKSEIVPDKFVEEVNDFFQQQVVP